MYGRKLASVLFWVDIFSPFRRYVDWRIIPILAIVFSVGLIDRLNLGVAYTAGMGVDLVLIPFHIQRSED